MIGLLLKTALLVTAAILFIQWCLMVFKVERSLSLFSLRVDGNDGHNMVLGDIGGLLLGISLMTVLFVFHNPLWMYPLMLLSVCVIVGRCISFAQQGVSHIGVVGMGLEAFGLLILALFCFGFVHY